MLEIDSSMEGEPLVEKVRELLLSLAGKWIVAYGKARVYNQVTLNYIKQFEFIIKALPLRSSR